MESAKRFLEAVEIKEVKSSIEVLTISSGDLYSSNIACAVAVKGSENGDKPSYLRSKAENLRKMLFKTYNFSLTICSEICLR